MPEPVENVPESASSSLAPDGSGAQGPVKKKTGGSVRLLLWVLFVISVLVISTGLKIKKKRLFQITFAISDEVRQEWVQKAKEDPYVNFLKSRSDWAESGIQYDVVAKKNIDEHLLSQEALIVQQYLPNKEALENMRQLSQSGPSEMAAVYDQSLALWKKHWTTSWIMIGGGLVLFAASVIMLAKTQ
ncbi:MAG: hypothetical protein H8E62_11700 [Planctomycetes bacterium]|nr:hypothetical protein [Planctomycetota bacterium]